MQVRAHSRALPASSRTAEARGLAAQVQDWLLLVEASRNGDRAAPLVVERPDGSAVAIHLLRPPDRAPAPPAAPPAPEPIGEMLSVGALRALGLTPREAEVMQILARGKSNQEIAAHLTLSVRTVQKHLENAYEKLGAGSRIQAVRTAWAISRSLGQAAA